MKFVPEWSSSVRSLSLLTGAPLIAQVLLLCAVAPTALAAAEATRGSNAVLGSGADEAPRTGATLKGLVTWDPPRGEISGRGVIRVFTPKYPEDARKSRKGGVVEIRVLVDSAGVVVRAIVDKSSGTSELDNVARNAAKAFKFVPLAEGEGESQSGVILFTFFVREIAEDAS